MLGLDVAGERDGCIKNIIVTFGTCFKYNLLINCTMLVTIKSSVLVYP
jgi:hypothetical protein